MHHPLEPHLTFTIILLEAPRIFLLLTLLSGFFRGQQSFDEDEDGQGGRFMTP
jgi:hypothetical protein